MANIKSAQKRVLTSQVQTIRNQAHRSKLRTLIKNAGVALEANADNKAEAVSKAVKAIDSAAGRGIIHKNKAARKKSQLVTRLNG